jgi:O-antigen/teichoic acid export membrane protein
MRRVWYDNQSLVKLLSPGRLWDYAKASWTRSTKHWLRKGTWAVLDQGLFATSNFILNVLLARWLSPDDYGAFGLTFAIFLLLGSVHSAMLTEPLLVFGPGKYKDRLSEYMGALLYGHLSFAGLGSVVLLLISGGFALSGSEALAVAMLALALAGPFILLLWLMRRMCYTRSEPRLAASGGAWYMFLMLAGAWILYWQEWLSVASALGVMAFSAMSTSLWLTVRLRVRLPPLRRSQLVRDALADHWRYGRWSVGNQSLNWVPMNIYYVIIPVWGGLAAGASFKALMNLIMPMLQAVWALSILLLPTLVQARDEGRNKLDSSIRVALIPFVIGPTLYWLLLALFHQPLVSWLYEGKYGDYAVLLWLLGLSPIVASVKQVMGQSLRALERPDSLFFAYTLSAVVALTLGTALVYLWGIVGAGISLVTCQGVTAALAFVSYRRLRRLSQHQGSDA